MAKAIFHDDFNFSSRTRNAGWGIKASTVEQSYPEEVIAAAVSAGVAERVKPRRKAEAKAGTEKTGKE